MLMFASNISSIQFLSIIALSWSKIANPCCFLLIHRHTLVLHLCGGGREKKRPRKDVGSGRRPVFDGDDPMDSDYDAKEEIGSKKIVPHKARSKSALNAPPRRQPAAPW
jgi:hypothetical protein